MAALLEGVLPTHTIGVPRVVDQAICLRNWDWSETSQTVSILTRSHGVLRAIAKGAKRDNAPFSGGLELATRAEIVYIPKQNALAVITAWDLQELFPAVRASSRRFFAAMHLLDLAQHFVQEGDPHPEIFDALLHSLRALSTDPTGLAPILIMQWTCLDQAGLRPMLDRAADTGHPLNTAPTYALSPTLGGLVADPGPNPPPTLLRVRAETIDLLRALADAPTTQPATIPQGFPEAAVERAARLLNRYIHHALGRALHSTPAVFGPD